MKIHAIQTGTVRVHERQGEGRGLGRSLRTLLDRTWTEPLPIYAWLIEHPEGLIVVDTGETARTAERDYFPRWHPYHRYAVRLGVRPNQHVVPTPGHTSGHCSVVVLDDERTVFLAGDTSYTEDLLRVGALDGVCAMGGGEAAAGESIDRVLALARTRGLVYLPSHDPDSEIRLRQHRPLPLRAEPPARPAVPERRDRKTRGVRREAMTGRGARP